jgi:D-alanyl-D-alanine carboxypeptidase (penicillin-binding protein 5/6)
MHRHVLPLLLAMLPLSSPAAEEDLSAPPPVTAWSWAIADADTGEILWHHLGDEPRKTASTTKMMCAHLVLQMAARDPKVLDERVTFSPLADKTVGSTADIQAGETVTVLDALYGLMLPSGNDAGNALAEHFNARCEPPDETMLAFGLANPVLQSRVRFIAEMNREARRLQLTNTRYRASFGDGGTETDRTSTAIDLVKLAWHARQNPVFRTLAAARTHTAQVQQAKGGTRSQTWENSNTLLTLDLGYDGIKTGSTNQAGECLVASGTRQGDPLLVVVLGSTSDESRYTDARHLFRWAWARRAEN